MAGASLSPLTQFYLVGHPVRQALRYPTHAVATHRAVLDVAVGAPTAHWTSGGVYHRFSFVPDAGKKPASPAGEAEMPFEEALKKLETIVEAMESGDLPLESLLQRFEEGTRLVKFCQSRLEQAEVQIQK